MKPSWMIRVSINNHTAAVVPQWGIFICLPLS